MRPPDDVAGKRIADVFAGNCRVRAGGYRIVNLLHLADRSAVVKLPLRSKAVGTVVLKTSPRTHRVP